MSLKRPLEGGGGGDGDGYRGGVTPSPPRSPALKKRCRSFDL
jgi:hypothetical protein